jgi:hypothetical protein
MAATFRAISRTLRVGFWDSPASFIRESQDYVRDTNFDVDKYGRSVSAIMGDPDFYGYNPNSSLSVSQQYSFDEVTKFSDPTLLKDALNSFDDIVQKIDFGGNLEKSKLKFTSIPQGVFNFGLASKGLFRPIEYYSTEHKMVVDSEKVRNTEFKGEVVFFFEDANGNDSPLRIQQEGTYLVEKNCDGVIVVYDDNAKMFLPYKDNKPYIGCGKIDPIVNKPSRLRFTTTTKKVYMYREKLGGGMSPYVDLFLVVGGLGDMTTESMLVKNLPLMIISKFLNDAGIKTRLYAKRAYTVWDSYSNKQYIDYSFVIKDYGESLDFNQIAAFTSDKRFFRVNLWNLVPALVRKKENILVTGYGSTLYGRTSPTTSDELLPAFNMSRNYALNSSDLTIQSTKVTDPRLMIIGGVGDISGIDTLTNPNTVEKITNEIYRIGDYVSLMFSKNTNKTLGTIYQRELERQKNKSDKMSYIRNYLTQTILDNLVTIRPSQVENPNFATPKGLLDEIDEQSDELLTALKDFTK